MAQLSKLGFVLLLDSTTVCLTKTKKTKEEKDKKKYEEKNKSYGTAVQTWICFAPQCVSPPHAKVTL